MTDLAGLGEGKKIGVLGVGNLLLSDEGFGVHVLNHIEKHFSFPDSVLLMEAGTAGIYMSPFVEQVDPLIVIDVLPASYGEPGSIHYFNKADIKTGMLPLHLSPHQLGLLEVLDISELRDDAPEEVFFICTVPESLEPGVELGVTLQSVLPRVVDALLDVLAKYGCKPEKIGNGDA